MQASQRQVELVARQKLILAMGRFAGAVDPADRRARSGRLRGRVHAYQGVPVVVTYHPAYLLRNPADKARAPGRSLPGRAVRAAAARSA